MSEPTPQRLTDEELKALWTESGRSQAALLAKEHVPAAIRELAKVVKRRGVKGDATRVQAAKVILEQAEGKPTQRVVHQGEALGGIEINIVHFGTGEVERLEAQKPMQTIDVESRPATDPIGQQEDHAAPVEVEYTEIEEDLLF